MIRATLRWGQSYETITLGDSDIPYLRQYVPQEVAVLVGTESGSVTTRHASQNVANNPIDLFFLNSDKFVVNLFDPYHGNIRDAQLASVDIAFDLSAKLDSLLQIPLMVGTSSSILVTNFTLDGSPESNYFPHSRIFPGNLPTGNIITLSTNGAQTLPRLDVLVAIQQYVSQWGAGAFEGGDLAPVEVRVASILAASFSKEFSATSFTNIYQEQVYQTPFKINYGGRDYIITPDNTIDPASKYVYVRFNLPVGLLFDKPAGAKNFSQVHDELNEEVCWQRGLYGTAIPYTFFPHWLAVKFQS